MALNLEGVGKPIGRLPRITRGKMPYSTRWELGPDFRIWTIAMNKI